MKELCKCGHEKDKHWSGVKSCFNNSGCGCPSFTPTQPLSECCEKCKCDVLHHRKDPDLKDSLCHNVDCPCHHPEAPKGGEEKSYVCPNCFRSSNVVDMSKCPFCFPRPSEKGDEEKVPEVECPKCRAVKEDFDGFGVLYCEKCGYCQHASITEGKCDYCKLPRPSDNSTSLTGMNAIYMKAIEYGTEDMQQIAKIDKLIAEAIRSDREKIREAMEKMDNCKMNCKNAFLALLNETKD